MYRRRLMSALTLTICLYCSVDAFAGIVCYQYKYAPNLVRAVQKLLKTKGLYKGAVNGKWGPPVKAAVLKFQEQNGIDFATFMLRNDNAGQLEDETLKAMFGKDAPTGVTVLRNPHNAPYDIWSRECQ